jgi:preprotein translocase subunit SecF
MQLLHNVNIDFMKYKTQAVIGSTLINIFGLAIFIAQYMSGGLAVGIDFKGGTEVQVKFAKPTSVADVRAALDKGGSTAPPSRPSASRPTTRSTSACLSRT